MVWSLGQETSLKEEMATHSSILAWKIPCRLAGYSLWGHKELDMTEWLSMTKWIHQKSKGSDSISIFHGLSVEPVCPCFSQSFLDGEALLQGPCHLQHVPSALAWDQSPIYCITFRRVPLGRASEEWADPSFSWVYHLLCYLMSHFSVSGRCPSISGQGWCCPSPRTVTRVLTGPQCLYPWGKRENHHEGLWGIWRARGFGLQVPCSQESLCLWPIPEPEEVLWGSVGGLQPSQVSPCGQEHEGPQDVFEEMNVAYKLIQLPCNLRQWHQNGC